MTTTASVAPPARVRSRAAVPRGTVVLAALALLGVLGVVLAGVVWHLQGGRWFVVSTPSMGQELPVGTLVLTAPTTVAGTEVGDVVTFRSPGSRTTFTHRVTSLGPEGLRTRGDVNAALDAWHVTDRDLVGEVVWHAPGLGWLARGLPVLALGLAVVGAATRWLGPRRRHAARQVGSCLVVSGVTWWLSPWTGLARLGQSEPPAGETGVMMEVVSTGLLPVRVNEVDGPATVELVNGETGTLHLTVGVDRGAFDVASRLDLEWWGWVLVALCCLGPLFWSLAVGLPPSPTAATHRAHPVDPAGRPEPDPEVSSPLPSVGGEVAVP